MTTQALIGRRGEDKRQKRRQRFEAAKDQRAEQAERERLEKQERAGRQALIQTTPQGALSSQNSGRKRLSV